MNIDTKWLVPKQERELKFSSSSYTLHVHLHTLAHTHVHTHIHIFSLLKCSGVADTIPGRLEKAKALAAHAEIPVHIS